MTRGEGVLSLKVDLMRWAVQMCLGVGFDFFFGSDEGGGSG